MVVPRPANDVSKPRADVSSTVRWRTPRRPGPAVIAELPRHARHFHPHNGCHQPLIFRYLLAGRRSCTGPGLAPRKRVPAVVVCRPSPIGLTAANPFTGGVKG